MAASWDRALARGGHSGVRNRRGLNDLFFPV